MLFSIIIKSHVTLLYILCNGKMICVGVSNFVVANCAKVMGLFHCVNGFGHVDEILQNVGVVH